jgi:hypothetical protein
MEKDIKTIQERLMDNLERLDKAGDNLKDEVARSNAISQLANTYIKSCNLVIRAEESKVNVKNKIKDVVNNEK